jgi:soluble lytic murein transglycosylase-like protein
MASMEMHAPGGLRLHPVFFRFTQEAHMRTEIVVHPWAALLVTMLLSSKSVSACWEEAGARYNIHPQLLYAIAKTESGLRPTAKNRNRNGSYDIGIMQINTLWLPTLRRHGIKEEELWEPCLNIHVGAWILAQNIRRIGSSWKAVGAYNSGKPAIRLKYAQKVYKHLPVEVRAISHNSPRK